MNTKISIFCLLSLCIITVSISCGPVAKMNITCIKLNYPLVDYSGIGWISQTELAAFASDQDGGVLGYHLEDDDTLYQNRDIMSRLYISEGTFNRTRRTAIRSLARALVEMEHPS